MRKYIGFVVAALIFGCGSVETQSSVYFSTSTTDTESSGGAGGQTTSNTGGTTVSSGGQGGSVNTGGTVVVNCSDPTKSWDETSNYYGPVLPAPGEAPNAAAEVVWGPWDTDVKIVSFTVGWGTTLPTEIRTAYWLELGEEPTEDPNVHAVTVSTAGALSNSDGVKFVSGFVDPSQNLVKKGQYLVTAGLYDKNSNGYASYHDPTCSNNRTWYYRPIGCLLPDGSDPGPNHSLLTDPVCVLDVSAFEANWAFTIEVIEQ